ncbi:MAG: hypothetical protein KF892_23875 [Rhizobacter sp.]|nr:hypothetical protein [Rhizobacter sp.]
MPLEIQAALIAAASGLIGVLVGVALTWFTSRSLAQSHRLASQEDELKLARRVAYAHFLSTYTQLQLRPFPIGAFDTEEKTFAAQVHVLELLGNEHVYRHADALLATYADRRQGKECPNHVQVHRDLLAAMRAAAGLHPGEVRSNPSIERTLPGKPVSASHVKR